ncbi:Phosphomannomutase [Fasciolopsis buskii]|uniref:Phosphomannomutase n=1 Tax=Fasciolopsis buskii TaxID=27845 RepID=A0A8E0VPK5_9TREM|nr:Phosphomannomutase [Fasciolopsis buski]
MRQTGGVICLFDVDGTLTKPRNVIKPEFLQQLLTLQSRVPIAVVSGSDFSKVAWQLGGEPVMEKFGYVFSENGLVVHRFGKLIQSTSIVDHLGEELIQNFINYALGYMCKLVLPRKRGTFVEFRKGLINICPVGRSCTQAERDEFAEYDDGGNDYEVFNDPRTIGHTVKSPEDTSRQLDALFPSP